MGKSALIARLKELKATQDCGFKSQNDCISWANDVAPLLAFDENMQNSFLEKAAYINTIGLSANLQGTALNFMVSILQQAIISLERGPIANLAAQTVPLQLPERMTLAWLWHHVSPSVWGSFLGLLFTAFVVGIAFSQSQIYTTVAAFAQNITNAKNMTHPGKITNTNPP